MAASTARYGALPSDTVSPREILDRYVLRPSPAAVDTTVSGIDERFAAPARRGENPCRHHRHGRYPESPPRRKIAVPDREPDGSDSMLTTGTIQPGGERQGTTPAVGGVGCIVHGERSFLHRRWRFSRVRFKPRPPDGTPIGSIPSSRYGRRCSPTSRRTGVKGRVRRRCGINALLPP
jgi:hypothetical protein